MPPESAPSRPSNALPGITLEQMLIALVERTGWETMGRAVAIRCFTDNPSIASLTNRIKTKLRLMNWLAPDKNSKKATIKTAGKAKVINIREFHACSVVDSQSRVPNTDDRHPGTADMDTGRQSQCSDN